MGAIVANEQTLSINDRSDLLLSSISHIFPENPGMQLHRKSAPMPWQVPLFRHGLGLQALTTRTKKSYVHVHTSAHIRYQVCFTLKLTYRR